MSVYTSVTRDELEVFLKQYTVGDLIDFEGISEGVENTNYFVSTSHGEFVLTLFETLSAAEIPWYLELVDHLADKGVPSPAPLPTASGLFLSELKGKPAALAYRLRGKMVETPEPVNCGSVGTVLADIHLVGMHYPAKRSNERSLAWMQDTAKLVSKFLSEEDQAFLADEVAYHTRNASYNLPKGIIHADMFRDNVLISSKTVSGVIDFFFACYDNLLFDIAIVVNDWCRTEEGTIDSKRADYLVDNYQTRRAFTEDEVKAWPQMLRLAALRFWISRLYDMHFPRDGDMTSQHNPDVMKNLLQWHIDNPQTLYVIPELNSPMG